MTSTSNSIRLAIVGIHNQGIDHLEAIRDTDGIELTALCDTNRQLLEKVASDYSLRDIYLDEDLSHTAERSDVDALVIALPHHLHPMAVDLAVKEGKHLLKEKPLARTLSEAHVLARKVREAGLVMHTGVQRRHHSTYQRLGTALDGHRIKSASLEMTIAVPPRAERVDEPPTWRDDYRRSGGGVLIDLGYHGIDLMHYLVGPLEVLSCITLRGDIPCPPQVIEDDSRVWAVAGPSWVHMRFGRAAEKREHIVIDTDQGRFVANRESLHYQPAEGEQKLLHQSKRSWEDTMKEQFTTFRRAIEAGEVGTNDLPAQIPTMRFIENCYSQRVDQGFAALEGEI